MMMVIDCGGGHDVVVFAVVQVHVTQPQNQVLVTVDEPLAQANQSLDSITRYVITLHITYTALFTLLTALLYTRLRPTSHSTASLGI